MKTKRELLADNRILRDRCTDLQGDVEQLEAELQQYKDKTCESCYYNIDNAYCANNTLYNEDMEAEGQMLISPDFYCNKYEPKD
jgi:hypothetical protein